MKVDKNQPAFPCKDEHGFNREGIPLRLEIASRLMAAEYAAAQPRMLMDRGADRYANEALQRADALIKEHNRTCEEKK